MALEDAAVLALEARKKKDMPPDSGGERSHLIIGLEEIHLRAGIDAAGPS